MSLANVSIVGNVIQPPTQTVFSSGKTKTTLVIAVPDRFKAKTTEGYYPSDYYRVEAWDKLGEVAHRFIAKGNQVTATGRLSFDRWQDRQGKDKVTPIVHAYQISLPPLPPRQQSENSIHNEGTTPNQVDTASELYIQTNGEPINPIDGELQFTEEEEEDEAAAELFANSATA